jgi:hypothetical protein
MFSALIASYSLLVLGGQPTAPVTAAREDGPSFEIETTLRSRYVFRGVPMSPGPVTQFAASTTAPGLTLYAWGNVLLRGTTPQPALSELNFGLSYERFWKALKVEPALDGYVYRYRTGALATSPSTAEISVKVSHTLGASNLFTRQIVDVVAYQGAYYGEAGISRDLALSGSTALAAELSVGWGSAAYNRAFGVPSPALNVVAFEASLVRGSPRRLSLEPHVAISHLCDGRLRRRIASGLLVSVGATAKLGR